MGQARSTYREKRNLDTVLAPKPKEKTQGETQFMCEDKIKGIGREGVDGIHRIRIGIRGGLM